MKCFKAVEAKERFSAVVRKKSWPDSFVTSCEPLFFASQTFGRHRFSLIHPGFVFIEPLSAESQFAMDICGDFFFPIGSCLNNDLLVVSAVETSGSKLGNVCVLFSSQYNNNSELLGKIKIIAEDLDGFLKNIEVISRQIGQ